MQIRIQFLNNENNMLQDGGEDNQFRAIEIRGAHP